jgi:hypothetical protein
MKVVRYSKEWFMIRHKSIRVAALASIVFLGSACNDDRKPAPTAPSDAAPEASVGNVAYLTISDSAPAAGSSVIVTGYAAGKDVTFGSFAAQLTFAPAAFTYVGEAPAAAGMRAVNAKAGDIAIAGVNLDGFEDGRLFAVELRVERPAAIGTLELSMKELTGVDYKNQRAALSVQRAVRFARSR